MDYKLLVLDLDGTLTNSEKEISTRTKNVLIAAQERGLKIVLASGRPTFGIVPLAKELKLDQYNGFILSYNGGEIINCTTEEVLHKKVLSPTVIPYLYRCASEKKMAILSYKKDAILTEHPSDVYIHKEAYLNKMRIQEVPNFVEALTEPVAKCLIVGEPTALIELEKTMSAALQETMNVFRSEPYFLELVPKGIDKAESLALLLAHLNLSPADMMACGDGFNDLSMIVYAGLGIAMENAQLAVKEAAHFVTRSNDADGVAYAVEKFIFKEQIDSLC